MLEIETTFGGVPVWGRLGSFAPDRRLLLIVRGAFAEENQLLSAIDRHPEADVALVHLPGMNTQPLRSNDIPIFASAFDEVVTALPNVRVLVVGLSIGGVVAFAMRKATRVLAVDTPLTTTLWPVRAHWDAQIAQRPELSWLKDRKFDALDTLRAPTRLLLASDPLGVPRKLARLPSLVSEDDRAAYDAHACVTVEVVPDTGHNIARSARLYRAICEELDALGGPDNQDSP
jgi:pimeloyl-ACP methyl ester carboxylesterase